MPLVRLIARPRKANRGIIEAMVIVTKAQSIPNEKHLRGDQ